MIETVFNAPDLATLVNAAVAMGYYDPVAHKITASGSIATGGAYFLNMVGVAYYATGATTTDIYGNPAPVMAALPGIWGRLRHNGDPAKMPTLPNGSGVTLYRYSDTLGGWSSDGVTLAPPYISGIGVIA
jgi:hypothetical protein